MSVEHDPSMRRPTAGIDWASIEHALAIVGPDGVEVQRMLVEHTAAGLRKLLRCLQQTAVLEVGIERPDGPVVEALLDAGLTVFVIAPNQIKHLRRRYGAAGNKDDRFDAYVHPHATRILARAWLHVIWRCWQDRVPYDPTRHRALQAILAPAA